MGEPGVEAFAIGAVAIQVERGGLAEHCALGHQADGHPGAVRRGGPEALAEIVVGVERAQHRGFLEHLLGAVGEGQLADLRRAVERLVAQANHRAGELQGVLHVQAISGIRQVDPVGLPALGMHLDDRQATLAQAENQRAVVQAHAFEHHLRVMAAQFAPALAGRGVVSFHAVQGEVDPALVAADQPGPVAVDLAVVDIIFVAFLARRQAAERRFRGIGIQHPGFAGGLAAQQQHQLALGTGAVAVEKEASVFLVEHQLGRAAAESMAVQLVRPVAVVQLAEEQGLAVVGPGHAAIAIGEGQLADRSSGQFLDE
ncbi:hypothetical protein D3C85_897460 [compost metagenome]